jgi:hypothetical protein
VGHRTGLDGRVKSRPPTGIRSPDRPARSESLYRLSYPGPRTLVVRTRNAMKNISGLSVRRLRFDPRSVQSFMMGEFALGEVLSVLLFFRVSIIPPVLRIPSFIRHTT